MAKRTNEHSSPAMDPALRDARPTDIFIPIMGVTGAGKSTFINCLLKHIGDPRRARVGNQLVSCTDDLESIIIDHQAYKLVASFPNLPQENRIVFLDTPSFDNTNAAPDYQAFKRTANWLQESYKRKMILGGVIYLHDISQNRFSGTAQRDFNVFKGICGEGVRHKVVLVTTNWGLQGDSRFETREEELRNGHWREMLTPKHGQTGATVMRLDDGMGRGEAASAWAIVARILDRLDVGLVQKAPGQVLQIQEELVMQKKPVSQTEAGRELKVQLQKASRAQGVLVKVRAKRK